MTPSPHGAEAKHIELCGKKFLPLRAMDKGFVYALQSSQLANAFSFTICRDNRYLTADEVNILAKLIADSVNSFAAHRSAMEAAREALIAWKGAFDVGLPEDRIKEKHGYHAARILQTRSALTRLTAAMETSK